MNQFFAFLSGMIIAIMVAINGKLAGVYGIYFSTVIIYFVGIAFSAIAILLSRKKFFRVEKKELIRPWMYLGGVLGGLTTIFNNLSYGKISITAIVALGLLAQTIVALVIDMFGLFGMEKRNISKSNLVGIVISLFGIIYMLIGAEISSAVAVVLSLLTGVTVIANRMINANFAVGTSAIQGSFINHVTGLPICILFIFILGKDEIANGITYIASPAWYYIGGAMGVVVVLMCNMISLKIPAFQMTVLTFIGQILAGLIIDLAFGNSIDNKTIIGGLIISVGIGLNLLMQNKAEETA